LSWQRRGRLANGFQNRQVACATAQVAIHVRDDFRICDFRFLIEERFRGKNHPRSAKSALECEVIEERLLQRMQSPRFVDQTFNRGDSLAADFIGEKRARAHRKIVDQDRATAAHLRLAGYLYSRQTAAPSQDFRERLPRLNFEVCRFSVQ
jgi:hypothetical protein